METSSCSQVPLQDGSQKMCESWGREGMSGVSEGEVGQYLLRGLANHCGHTGLFLTLYHSLLYLQYFHVHWRAGGCNLGANKGSL